MHARKFILIDHSICGYGGHYFEYAIHVLRAAKQKGFQPVLVVNRQFQKNDDEKFEIIPVFKYDFWGTIPVVVEEKCKKEYSYKLSDKIAFLKIKLIFSSKAQKYLSLLNVLLNNRYGSLILNVAARPVHVIKSITAKIKEKSEKKHFFEHINQVSEQFNKDISRFFTEIEIHNDDVIFIPTISEHDLTGLGYFFEENEKIISICRWHLLFRRDLYSNRIASSAIVNNKTISVKTSFDGFRNFYDLKNIFFYTDTDELTQQYKNLNIFDFKTLAIPVNALYEKYQQPLRTGKCTVTYLGDARAEKGFQYLPRLIMDLWSDYVLSGSLCFRLQANFNSSYQDPSVIIAKSQLLGLPREQVELVDRVLSSVEYTEFVLSSDVILILYDSNNYSARSSGIFVEAMMAGKPVVVPAGTWMSKQLTPYIVEYHKTLLETFISSQGETLPTGKISSFTFGGEKSVFTEKLEIPEGGALLLLFFEVLNSVDGLFVKVIVDTYDGNENHMDRFNFISNPVGVSGELSYLLPVVPNAKSIVVSFMNAYDVFMVKAHNARFRFFTSDTLPARSAVGGIYTETDQISKTLCEVVDNLQHYRATAAVFSSDWRTRQGVDRLIECLLCE